MLTRRTTFRLYPNATQEAKLFEARRLHAYLYNACVEQRKTAWKHDQQNVSYYDQQNALPAFKECWPEYKELGSHALQATVKRVDFAYQRLFKGLSKRVKFRSIRDYSGWTYPDLSGWKVLSDGVNGDLQLNDLGIKIQMRGQAKSWGKPTTCTILYRNGKWFASVTANVESVSRISGPGAVGIDLGCKDAVTLSTGQQIVKPAFIKVGDVAVKRASKALRRKRAPNRKKRIKASNRWRKAQRQKSKLQRQVTRQRENWLHQVSNDIVSRNSLVAGEKLNIKGMTRKPKKGSKRKRQKSGLNRSILAVGMGTLTQMLKYKLAEAGGFYVESPTIQLKPTQRCAQCWELTPKTLSDRVHVCQHCGHTENRDVNAAQVNLMWARGQELASIDAEQASSTDCGSMRQLAVRKRQKRAAQRSGCA